MADGPDFAAARGDAPIAARFDGDPRVRRITDGKRGHVGKVVVYWAQAARRATSNAALSYAIDVANERGLPLLVYEALRPDYPFASDRFHRFVLEAARESAKGYRARGARYAFFLPASADEARGVVAKLSEAAALIVTDDHPSFVFPAHAAAIAKRSRCPVDVVDDNCVVPLSLFPKEEWAARTLRPKLGRALASWLRPVEENACTKGPARGELPFAPFDAEHADLDHAIARLPIDHDVALVPGVSGARSAALARFDRFVALRLGNYGEDHNHPDESSTSAMSAYLHFGVVGARELALIVCDARADRAQKNAFLEQLLVRRTLAFNLARTSPTPTSFDATPAWAKKALDEHRGDARAQLYTRDQLEGARTHDEVWNAAQRELLRTGAIHNYLRMLWGKCVIQWKKTPEEAFADLVYLNDKYALDGRDPNSYTSILWCFGKHDRPWVKRPVLGTVRYMSTASARKKLRMEDYLAAYRR